MVCRAVSLADARFCCHQEKPPTNGRPGCPEGSPVRPSTTPPLVQEQPASTRPIGTAWLRLGWEHGTIARRGCTPAGARRPRQAGGTEREFHPVAPRKQIPLRHPITQPARPPHEAMTHTFCRGPYTYTYRTRAHAHAQVKPTNIQLVYFVDNPIDPGCPPHSFPRVQLSPSHPVPYIEPLSPAVALPFDITPPACHRL